jgi:phospholipase C
MGPIVSQSESAADGLTAPGACGSGANALNGANGAPVQGRCGYGPRLPLLVISPWAKQNFVDHTLTDQSSVIRFIEDNWLNGERVGDGSFDNIANSIEGMFDFRGREPKACDLYLDEVTGQPVHRHGDNGCRGDFHRF